MSDDKGLTVNGAPRKRRLKGFDPLINARAPTSLIEMVKAKAKARNVAYSVVVREALSRYVGNDEGRERAA
jgi:predicted DNA binding CopG/RHH family protein